jgi:perosamine synthetase
MRIGRTIPPAAAPIYFRDIMSGVRALSKGEKEIERFEKDLRHLFGVKYCFTVSSGKTALYIILKALKELHPGRDEVLIPAYTCYSVPSAIMRAGLKVKVCDIDPITLDFDFDKLSQILSLGNEEADFPEILKSQASVELDQACDQRRLLAAIGIHLFGLPADIGKLRDLVLDPEATVVEDAAQAMGAKGPNGFRGIEGDVGIFSLGRGKALTTGEGGVILTNRDDLGNAIGNEIAQLPAYRLARLVWLVAKSIVISLFSRPGLFWLPKAMTFLHLGETIYDPDFPMLKLSSFQAGMAHRWQIRLAAFRRAREANALWWSKVIRQLGLRSIGLNHTQWGDIIRFPVLIDDEDKRERIIEQSERHGLGVMPVYPDAITNIPELATALSSYKAQKAKEIARSLITLPTHPFLGSYDRMRIYLLLSSELGNRNSREKKTTNIKNPG